MTVRRTAACFAAATLAPFAAGSGAASGFCPDLDAQCCHIRPASDPRYSDFKADATKQVPGWFEVDLDMPPAQRWAHIVQPKAKEIQTMINHFKHFLGKVSSSVFGLLEAIPLTKLFANEVLNSMGEYGEEIRGIAAATGIPEVELLVYNLMYEIEGGCTSIVAQDEQGHMVHGRNLDFGLFFGEDLRHLQWTLTEDLRPILSLVRFKKGGEVVFNSTVFLGYVGLLTGAKKDGFSISVNTRYDGERWAGLISYLRGKDRSGKFLSFMTREVMMEKATYDEALATLQSTKILGPAYVILGGTKPGQGAVLARNATGVPHQWLLEDAVKSGNNFVVETNWDSPKDPFFDNRRSPAEHCLADRYRQHIDFEGMFTVLSAHPNRNRLTTYTALMSAQTGEFEAYLQYCKERDCALWAPAPQADVTIYKLDFPSAGECGQVPCPADVAHFPEQFGGFKEGTCADAGYTVPDGTKEYKVPIWGKTVELTLFKKPSASLVV